MNIGNTKERSILDLANAVQAAIGTDAELEFGPLPDDDPMRRCPDTSRARELLGWEARTSLEDGLVPTVEWFADRRG